MRLVDHFNAFMHPDAPRNYPVVAVNYHKVFKTLLLWPERESPEASPAPGSF